MDLSTTIIIIIIIIIINIHLYSAFLLVIQSALQSVNTKFKYNITGF